MTVCCDNEEYLLVLEMKAIRSLKKCVYRYYTPTMQNTITLDYSLSLRKIYYVELLYLNTFIPHGTFTFYAHSTR